MKLSWGTGIAIVYATFVLCMVGLVFASRKRDPRLVDKNYYNLDLNYQQHYNKKLNTASLTILPEARYDASNKTVDVQFPKGMTVQAGTAKFFRAVTLKDDFTLELQQNSSNGLLQVPATHLNAGKWHVELDWESDGKQYFYETTFII
jgi:nitrogen fixation protein FixH